MTPIRKATQIRHLIADDLDRRARRRIDTWSDQYEKLRARGGIDHRTAMRHMTGIPDLSRRIGELQYAIADLIRP
jgi:hypothetical protein